ncbi:hypothetical protein Plhal304r1_c084g0168041 [Plasmopara halstedii]
MDLNQLGQLTKRPGGNLRIKVKTKEACFRLERQEVTILGSKYRFREFDILADRFYIDVSSVDSDVDADLMLKRFFELGAQPIYGTFRDVNLDAVMTTATWRVYLRSNECRRNFRGRLCLRPARVCWTYSPRSCEGCTVPSPTHVVRIPLALCAGAPRSNDDDGGSSQHKNNHAQRQSPSQQPRTFAAVVAQRPRRRHCNSRFDRCHRQQASLGVATSNYFDVLSKVEVDFDCCSATLDEQHGPRFQIVPRKVKAPVKLSESKEASHFLTKHHTSIVKTEKPLPIQEIVAEMESTEETADLQLLPDRLAVADSKVSGSRKVLRNTNNVDTVVYYASCSTPLAFNTVLLQEMNATSSHVSDLAHLHLINRVLSATDPDESTTFAHKWAKHLASADSTKELIRASRALALFELMLMCTAPRIFEKDYWLQHVTGMSIAWIPAHNRRLLHPNLLLALLRSKLGKICFKLWEDVQWQGSLLDDLEALRAKDRR